MPKLVIIDGYSLLFRAFFATRYLSTSDGRPTNALFGFTGMLFSIMEKERPVVIAVALDAPGKTFRHVEYTEYKGTRRETADELKVQLKESRKLIETLGIPSVECVGFEADDVVGTITLKAREHGYDSIIVTGDLDALQLVDDHTSVLTLKQGVTDTVVYDTRAVEERYGFGPKFVPDFKALKGDSSDNIPGVPGIGDKGAADLIAGFGNIEQMIERMAEIPAKYQKKLEGNEQQMLKSKWLATIVRSAPVDFEFKPFVISQTQIEAAVRELESLEFRQWVKRAPQVLGRYLSDRAPELPMGAELGASDSLIENVTESLDPIISQAVSYDDLIMHAADSAFAIHFPTLPAAGKLFESEPLRAFVAVGRSVMECDGAEALRLLAERPSQAVGHDLKAAFRATGKRLATPHFDTMLAAFVLRSERSHFAVRDLAQGYLDVSPPETDAQIAVAVSLLEKPLRERLEKERQYEVLTKTELPLIPILATMENTGIRADREQLRVFSLELQTEIETVEERVYELAGSKFLIGSPKQLGEVLFDQLKVAKPQKTKTGYATGVEVLSDLASEHEIVSKVLRWRELTKLKSTYADSLERLVREDGRIHTTYNQAGAATGRFSSNYPNLQNIPIRTELGRGIRKAFQASPGYRLLSVDYSQIELRVLAHFCKEPALVEAFQRREDVHAVTARLMFDLGDAQPTKEQRREAKMLNYAVLYGVTEYGLQQQLGAGFDVARARALIQLYGERFPTVKGYTDSIVQEAKSKGFTVTLLGRRRYFPDIHAARMNDRKYAERQAMNAPLQGTAADMMKLAMVGADERLKGKKSRMLLTVHDELVFDLADGEESLVSELVSAMENALPLDVPVEADAKIGHDWNDMTPVERAS